MPVIDLKNCYFKYDQHWVLEDVCLSVKNNEYLAIIGPNGGGKTTLLKCILGLLTPNQGTIKILGGSIDQNRKYIGYVPQVSRSDREYPINVLDTVLMGRLGTKPIYKRTTKKDIEIAKDSLNKVEMIAYQDRQIGALSEGQRERVFIARALASEPKILLLDEPTASVDQHIQDQLYELFDKLKKQMAVVMVTHDLTAVSKHVDYIACMNQKMHYHGSKELSEDVVRKTYGCHIDLIAHGHPHRVLREHQ